MAERGETQSFEVGRYFVDETSSVREIVSMSAPNVRLRIEPGKTAGRRAVKRAPTQTIFLDGAFDGPPFHDNQKRIYSLDHHAGCLRSITLATCEQAAAMLLAGLPIHEGTWTLFVNDADLDSLLAAWVLMNHIDLLGNDSRLLAAAMPLLKVEGNIDTWGFGKEILTALPRDIVLEQRSRIDELMRRIIQHRRTGRSERGDLERLVLDELDAIDRLMFPVELLARLHEYRELGRRRLRGRRIAILCRSEHGIYEVEAYLRERYGKLLGIIVLDQGDGRFTIRRSDAFLGLALGPLYKALNSADRNAISSDGNENHWGGADDIGGSPRETGSALSGAEILNEVGRIYGERRSPWRWLADLFAKEI